MSKPVYVKSDETRLAGLERDVRFLKRRSQTPEPDTYGEAGGIQFDLQNEGGYLVVNTHDVDEDVTTRGMYLSDDSGGGIEMRTTGDGGVVVRSSSIDNGIEITDSATSAGHGIKISSARSSIILSVGPDMSGEFGNLILVNIPDFDPHIPGAVWNSAGVLTISSG